MSVYIYPPVSVTTLPPMGGATSANQLAEIAAINAAALAPIRILKNGTVQTVNKDAGTPANTVAIPVEIVSASGTTINITAGDINIQTTSEGSNFDSMRIGSGSGFYAEVTSNNDLSTFDSNSFTELVEINTQTMSIDLKTPNLGQALAAASVPVVLPVSQITALTPPAAITGFALETTQVAGNVLTGAVNETAPATDTASSGLNGRLQRIAQNITSMAAKIPVLGQQLKSASQSITFASDMNLISPLLTGNSSNVALGANAVFTGPWEDVSQYAEIKVSVFSNVASATNGISIQQSSDGVNIDIVDTYTLSAGTGMTLGVGVDCKFARIVFTNGATIQTSFRLQTIYHALRTKPSTNKPGDARSNEADMEEVLAYNAVFNGTTWDRIRSAFTGPVATILGYQNVLPVGKFTTADPALTNNQWHDLRLGASGRLLTDASATPLGTMTVSTQTVTELAVSTFTVPVGAKRMVISNNAGDGVANRIRIGNAAVAPAWPNTGMLLGVGAFTSEIPATTFTCIAESADSNANVTVMYFY